MVGLSTLDGFRYKILVEYDGTGYSGWAMQGGTQRSIQGALQNALMKLTAEQHINVYGAGRTDAGVHALAQVAHFDLHKHWKAPELISGMNHFLMCNGDSIVVLHCNLIDSQFHARFSATSRSYLYRIITCRKKGIIDAQRAWCVSETLDVKAMNAAAQVLVGQHDFTSFRSSSCQAKSPIRNLDVVKVYEVENELQMYNMQNLAKEVRVYVKARSFLHNQVRIIVGQLRKVGTGECSTTEIKRILDARDRRQAAITAPAYGLYFLCAEYNETTATNDPPVRSSSTLDTQKSGQSLHDLH